VDGVNFEPVGRVNAAGTSSATKNYKLVDASPLKGTSFYRLVQTDLDGRNKLSEVRKIVNARGRAFDAKLAVNNGLVNISFLSTQQEKITLRVFDLSGRAVSTKSWTVNAGSTQGQIRLSRGNYVLNFSTERNESIVQKIVID
jgi:hypothetical protein